MRTRITTKDDTPDVWAVFGELEEGDYFVYDDKLYIKTMQYYQRMNAVCVNDGEGRDKLFDKNELVKWVSSVTITYKLVNDNEETEE